MTQPSDAFLPSQAPTTSADGAWRWTGSQWVPNTPPPPSAAPPHSSGGRRRARGAFVVLGVVTALIVVVAVIATATSGGKSGSTASRGSTATSHTATAPSQAACTQPCATADGATVTVSQVQYGASSGNEFEAPEPGNVYVTMQVDLRNSGDREANLNAYNFVLRDGRGIKHTTSWLINSCPGFDPVNITKGADSGRRPARRLGRSPTPAAPASSACSR
jgi:Domain of unknown function (DUF4352)